MPMSCIKSPEILSVGILKLNFDGSYIQQIHMGGMGVSFEILFQKVVKKNSDPVNSFDSNAAEVYAMLIGFYELRKMGG